MRMTDAFAYPVRDPLKLLAAAVLARWVEDRQRGREGGEIGDEWAEAAEVPLQWLTAVVADDLEQGADDEGGDAGEDEPEEEAARGTGGEQVDQGGDHGEADEQSGKHSGEEYMTTGGQWPRIR